MIESSDQLVLLNDGCGVLFPPDDLASKANIIIDPAEIQATSMDDLDEDEESGAAQVLSISENTTQPRHH